MGRSPEQIHATLHEIAPDLFPNAVPDQPEPPPGD